jgi:hypothetical protein
LAVLAAVGKVIGLAENVRTLPVPSHVQNDWANAGVARVASIGNMMKIFFMFFLLLKSRGIYGGRSGRVPRRLKTISIIPRDAGSKPRF